jgi:AAA ATPase domain
MSKICGRIAEIDDLQKALALPNSNLEIVGVSGYGGVGKTHLVRHVIDQVRPEQDGRLVLWIDGSAKGLAGDFMRILTEMLAPQHLRGVGSSAKNEFFPQVRRLQKAYAAESNGLLAEVQKSDKSATEDLDRVKKAVLLLIKLGTAFNRLSGKRKGKDLLREEHLEDCADKAFELIQPYVEDSSRLPTFLQDALGMSYARKVRTQLFDMAADALLTDLTAMLVGWSSKDWAKYVHGKIKGFDRLLLIVDDFEILGRALAPFLLGHLLPLLKSAKFQSQVVVIGRDALRDADAGFEHHFASHITLQTRLKPFTEREALEMLKAAGYSEEKSREINAQCNGLPFLLTAFAESHKQDALFYQRFFDRTTRWMTDTQRDWFLALCYLDEVNQDTVTAMLPNEDSAVIVDWFRHEASVRDDAGERFRVKPFIREMVLQHHRNELGKKSQDEWSRRGKTACA